jgi:hypothetical protein
MVVGNGGRWANSFGMVVWVRVSVAIFLYLFTWNTDVEDARYWREMKLEIEVVTEMGEVTPHWAISARLPR